MVWWIGIGHTRREREEGEKVRGGEKKWGTGVLGQ
jgi:hypothetical protein